MSSEVPGAESSTGTSSIGSAFWAHPDAGAGIMSPTCPRCSSSSATPTSVRTEPWQTAVVLAGGVVSVVVVWAPAAGAQATAVSSTTIPRPRTGLTPPT